VVSTSDLKAVAAGGGGTYAEAADHLRGLVAATPSLAGALQIVTLSEIA
jgi:hypothetical protein